MLLEPGLSGSKKNCRYTPPTRAELVVEFLAAALAACSSSQYHVVLVLVLVVLVVPELLSEFECFGFLRGHEVTLGLLMVILG